MDYFQYQKTIRDAVHAHFAQAKAKNRSYSIRAMAKRFGLNAVTLSEFMRANRNISKRNGDRIAKKLDLTVDQGKRLTQDFASLSPDPKAFGKFLSTWYFTPILCLLDVHGGVFKPRAIASALDLDVATVTSALNEMLQLRIVEKSKSGLYLPTSKSFSIEGDAYKKMRRTHRQMLTYAIKVLKHLDDPNVHANSDITTNVMRVNRDKIPEAKKAMEKFQFRLTRVLGAGRADDVYVLGMQLFPIAGKKGARNL